MNRDVSPNQARRALAILSVVYAVNLPDRQILSMLLEPIKAELGISDTALGFLTGTSSALFYATAGILIARWADPGIGVGSSGSRPLRDS